MELPELQAKIDELKSLSGETEWVEFKANHKHPNEIGEYISALSNGAALHQKDHAYLVWGIDDASRDIVGTSFQPRKAKKGNEDLEPWLCRLLNPRIDFRIYEFAYAKARLVLFEIEASRDTPVSFLGETYIRIGSSKRKLKDYPAKQRQLWRILTTKGLDWSAQLVADATLSDLDSQALSFARAQYREKHPTKAAESNTWDDATFLNKAKVCINGKVTRAALLLLGKEESTHFLSPAHVRITWVLRDDNGQELDYRHVYPPFILAGDQLLSHIRNLTIRQMPSGTLFPYEVTQYDPWVLRETLHNCIAHQDYRMGGRISIIETSTALSFFNLF